MKRMNASRAYLLIAAIDPFARGLIFLGLSAYYVRTIGMSPLQLVLVGTAVELTCFLFEVPTGVVADSVSRRLSVVIGGIMIGAAYVLTGLAPLFLAIIAAEVIRGIGETFISGAYTAWITDEVGAEHVGPLFARSSQVAQGSYLAGSLASVWLATIFGYQIPIVLGGAFLMVLYLVMLRLMPETGFQPARLASGNPFRQMAATAAAGARVVRFSPVVLLLVVGEMIRGAASEGFDRLWEASLLTQFNLPVLSLPLIGALDPVAWFAVLGIAETVIGVTVMEVVRRRFTVTGKTPNATVARWLITLYSGTALCILVFALSQSFVLSIAVLLLRGIFYGPPGPISGTWMNLHIPSNVRATVLSMNGQANAFGQIAGGPGVGWLGNRAGVRAAIGASGLLYVPILWLYARFVRKAGETVADV